MGEYIEYRFGQQRLIWYVFCLWETRTLLNETAAVVLSPQKTVVILM